MGKRVKKIRHSDEDVRFWAEIYTEIDITLEEIEKELKVSHSTTWWCFTHRLPNIDYDLYNKVMQMMNHNKHNKHNNRRVSNG